MRLFSNNYYGKKKIFKREFLFISQGGNLGAALRLAKDIMVTGKKMPVVDHKKV